MTYRLIWLDRAIDELTRLYLIALPLGYGEDVVQAAARVAPQLAADPGRVGESRAGHERVMFEGPLTVYFEVYDEEGVAAVTSVRFSGRW